MKNKNKKKNKQNPSNNAIAKKQEFDRAFIWMYEGIGRYDRLVNIHAPSIILFNERHTWYKYFKLVGDMLRNGIISLNDEGKRMFIKIGEYYKTLPSMRIMFFRMAEDPSTELDEWMDKIKDFIVEHRICNELKARECVDAELDKIK